MSARTHLFFYALQIDYTTTNNRKQALSMKPLDPLLRNIIKTDKGSFKPYDRYGTIVPGMFWLPLSGELLNGEYECFMLRMEPTAVSKPHEHMGHEEFLILEGSLIDNDDTEYLPGDFVSLLPGSKHSSRSPEGCLLLVILRGNNRALEEHELTEVVA
jgi:anti-sigma factor ChrR (cupin superfamily)